MNKGFLALTVAVATVAMPAAQQPTFHAEINYVELPVRVLDSKGNFIRDLKQADFQIFEDGISQEVATFGVIDLPAPVPGKAASVKSTGTPAGVLSLAALQQLEGRLYLFVVDDYHIRPQYSFRTRQYLQSFLREKMGPNDAAAIVFTSGIRSQDFTQDRQLLLSAVDRLNGMFDSAQPDVEKEVKARSIVKTVTDFTTVLGAIKGRHKALIFVTPGVGCGMARQAMTEPDRMQADSAYGTVGAGGASTTLCNTEILDGVRAAVHSDVSIYSLDPRGLQSPGWVSPEIDGRDGPGAAMQKMQALEGFGLNIFDGMQVLADETGGFVVTGTNNLNKAFDRIVTESSSYYVIGYYSRNDKADGTVRKNTIRVDRSGLQVLYRAAYVAPRP